MLKQDYLPERGTVDRMSEIRGRLFKEIIDNICCSIFEKDKLFVVFGITQIYNMENQNELDKEFDRVVVNSIGAKDYINDKSGKWEIV